MHDVTEIFGAAIQGQPAETAPVFAKSDYIRVDDAASWMERFDVVRPAVDRQLVDELKLLRFPSKQLDHQTVGFAELVQHRSWMLAWEMGTGKTATVAFRLAYGMQRGDFRGCILIACPLSVCNVWQDQLKLHAGLDSVVCVGDKKDREEAFDKLGLGGILICNYETLRTEFERLRKLRFDVVIADEAHRIKNSSALVNKAIRKIGAAARYRWLLTGTPCPNGPLDLFGTLLFLDPRTVGTNSKRVFEHRHAVYGKEVRPGIRIIVGYQKLGQLAQQLANVCSRVTKHDVCKDLPEKTYLPVRVPLARKIKKVYDELRKESVAMLESRQGQGQLTLQNVLTESLRLLQVCGGFVPDDDGTVHALEPNAKLDALQDLLDDMPGQQVVIFANFRAEVDAIIKRLGPENCSEYSGGVSHKNREQALLDWKSGKTKYFVASYAAREGLTLVEASTVIFFSRTYSLLDWLQSQDRIHRIGQKLPVTVLMLVAEGTVDEKVGKALEAKAELQDLMLGSSIAELL